MIPDNPLKRRSCTERQPGSSTGANRASKRVRGIQDILPLTTEALGETAGEKQCCLFALWSSLALTK